MTDRMRWKVLPDGPREARAFVRTCLHAWGLDALQDDAELLTSEVVTNALRHGDVPYWMCIDLTDDRVRVEVADAAIALPVPRAADPLDDGGRGLVVVGAAAAAWGSHAIAGSGKVVWFELATA